MKKNKTTSTKKCFELNNVYNFRYLAKESKEILLSENGVVVFRDSGKQTYCIPGFGDATETLKQIQKAFGVKKDKYYTLYGVVQDTIEDYRSTGAKVDANKTVFLLMLYIWNDCKYKIAKDGEILFVNRQNEVTIHSGYIMTEDFKNIINYYLEYESIN